MLSLWRAKCFATVKHEIKLFSYQMFEGIFLNLNFLVIDRGNLTGWTVKGRY